MANDNPHPTPYTPGTLVYTRRSLVEKPEELLVILGVIEPKEDEEEFAPVYLTRTASHSKKVVFHCEITPRREE